MSSWCSSFLEGMAVAVAHTPAPRAACRQAPTLLKQASAAGEDAGACAPSAEFIRTRHAIFHSRSLRTMSESARFHRHRRRQHLALGLEVKEEEPPMPRLMNEDDENREHVLCSIDARTIPARRCDMPRALARAFGARLSVFHCAEGQSVVDEGRGPERAKASRERSSVFARFGRGGSRDGDRRRRGNDPAEAITSEAAQRGS